MPGRRKQKPPARRHALLEDGGIPADHRGRRRCRRCGVLGEPGDVRHTDEFPDTPEEDRSKEILGESE